MILRSTHSGAMLRTTPLLSCSVTATSMLRLRNLPLQSVQCGTKQSSHRLLMTLSSLAVRAEQLSMLQMPRNTRSQQHTLLAFNQFARQLHASTATHQSTAAAAPVDKPRIPIWRDHEPFSNKGYKRHITNARLFYAYLGLAVLAMAYRYWSHQDMKKYRKQFEVPQQHPALDAALQIMAESRVITRQLFPAASSNNKDAKQPELMLRQGRVFEYKKNGDKAQFVFKVQVWARPSDSSNTAATTPQQHQNTQADALLDAPMLIAELPCFLQAIDLHYATNERQMNSGLVPRSLKQESALGQNWVCEQVSISRHDSQQTLHLDLAKGHFVPSSKYVSKYQITLEDERKASPAGAATKKDETLAASGSAAAASSASTFAKPEGTPTSLAELHQLVTSRAGVLYFGLTAFAVFTAVRANRRRHYIPLIDALRQSVARCDDVRTRLASVVHQQQAPLEQLRKKHLATTGVQMPPPALYRARRTMHAWLGTGLGQRAMTRWLCGPLQRLVGRPFYSPVEIAKLKLRVSDAKGALTPNYVHVRLPVQLGSALGEVWVQARNDSVGLSTKAKLSSLKNWTITRQSLKIPQTAGEFAVKLHLTQQHPQPTAK